MEPERWAKIESLYHAAIEKEPRDRAEFLGHICAADPDLQREVETLLGCADAELNSPTTDAFLTDLRQKDPELHDQVQRLLRAREDTVTIPDANGASQPSHNPGINDLIGPYRLLSVLGEGGMGIVYLAEQEWPIQRRVALKLIKPGIASPDALVRFESERQTLAMMEHPNIAHVYDAGATTGGQPYFVMEYVPGPSITTYCDEHKLANRERLKLFRNVCLAIHHAHQKGVIHQDIKPSNVLVTEHDGAPIPKVIDFGVAKAIEQHQASQTLFTLHGVLVGTPEYMSPEQASLDTHDVDASSDVYSLGVLLYELLVGALPFDPKELRKKGLAEILRIIREDNPTPLSSRLGTLPTAQEVAQRRDTDPGTLRRQLTGELNWITMRAMEKDRRRRYNSAAEFSSDIERYLNNSPVLASPPSRLYRLRKFVSKNRWPVAAAAAIVAALCAGLVTSTLLYFRAERSRELAESRELLYLANGSLNEDPERSLILGLYSWDKARTIVGGLEGLLHAALSQSRARLSLRGHQRELWCVAWSPDGRKLATASADGTAKVWDAESGRELLTLRGHQDGLGSVAWSPDGTKIATASNDKTAKLWEAGTGRELLTLQGHQNAVVSIAWSPDGKKLATASEDQTAKVWDAVASRELLTLGGHQGPVLSIAWSPDGSRLATASLDKTAKVWDASTGRELLTLHGISMLDVAWSPDGSKLATATSLNTTKVWEASTGREMLSLSGEGWHIAWSPDSRSIAATTSNGGVFGGVWEATTGRELLTLRGHQSTVSSIAWSPDGSRLATASLDKTAKVWEVSAVPELLTLRGRPGYANPVEWSPDGSKLATASQNQAAKVWDAATGGELLTLRGHRADISYIAWSPDGKKLATASEDKTAKVWDADSGRDLLTLLGHQDRVFSTAWSPDGSRLATSSLDRTAKVWDAGSGRELLALSVFVGFGRRIAWSPDGKKLATASEDQTAKVWDASTGHELLTLVGHQNIVTSVAWSPDGSKLATANWDQTAKVWDAVASRELLTLGGHQGPVLSIAWSPDGSKLATASQDGTAKVWESSTGRELFTLRVQQARYLEPSLGIVDVAWSPDGSKLATSSLDGTVQVYAIDPVLLLRLVRSRITRDLTPDECRRYLDTDHCLPLPNVP